MNPKSVRQFGVAVLSFSLLFIVGGVVGFFIGPIEFVIALDLNSNITIAVLVGTIGGGLGYFFSKLMSFIICLVSFGSIDIDC